ncbi:MAG: DinB family protein [Bacteroidetes bacterium]|nr:DinB family protein [Bacteroidota bacterium]
MHNQELLLELRIKIKNQLSFINKEIKDLPFDTLKFRPAKGKWSILDCIEHLNLTFDIYLPRVKAAVDSANKKSNNYSSGFFGDRMVTAMEPIKNTINNPMQTFRNMNPERSKRDPRTTIVQFYQYMEALEEQLLKSEDLDLGRPKVKSAIGLILRFKLGDCYRFLLAHSERHLLQCRKIMRVLATYQ